MDASFHWSQKTTMGNPKSEDAWAYMSTTGLGVEMNILGKSLVGSVGSTSLGLTMKGNLSFVVLGIFSGMMGPLR
jgi:hypothetical protein